jgi:hypothetical protein
MEDIEVPTEHLHEHIKEGAEENKDRWSLYVAISTAFMAVFAALGSLMAGHHSNEALIQQIKASDQWAYYQAKGIKYEITESIVHQSTSNNAEPPAELVAKQKKYKTDQEAIQDKAKEAENDSKLHLEKHVTLARSVTLFQISIALSAIAMLTRRKFMWYLSLALSLGGVCLFSMGLL